MIYAATGPSKPPVGFLMIIRDALRDLPDPPTEFVTGGAFGVDTAVFTLSRGMYPAAKQLLCVPSGFHYNTSVLTAYSGAEIEMVPGGYLKRDDRLIECCSTLLAFPDSVTEQLRSGTWATVRRARKAGRRILFAPLDGSARWEE